MHLAGLVSGLWDDPCRLPVYLADLAPRRGQFLPLACYLRADHFISPRAGQDGEPQGIGVYRIGQASVEGRDHRVGHTLMMIDIIVTGAALEDDTRFGVPDDRFNPA